MANIAETGRRVLAASDRQNTRFVWGESQLQETTNKSLSKIEVHGRDKDRWPKRRGTFEHLIGVRNPDGRAILGDERAIVHEYGPGGKLARRTKLRDLTDNPSEGYTQLTLGQIRRLTLSGNIHPQNILNLNPDDITEALAPREVLPPFARDALAKK